MPKKAVTRSGRPLRTMPEKRGTASHREPGCSPHFHTQQPYPRVVQAESALDDIADKRSIIAARGKVLLNGVELINPNVA